MISKAVFATKGTKSKKGSTINNLIMMIINQKGKRIYHLTLIKSRSFSTSISSPTLTNSSTACCIVCMTINGSVEIFSSPISLFIIDGNRYDTSCRNGLDLMI